MSVLIALPCYGGLVSDKTAKGLFNLGKDLRSNNIDHGLITLANESLITKGRSRIANFFMNNTQYEYVMFIDADVGFTSEDVLKLFNFLKIYNLPNKLHYLKFIVKSLDYHHLKNLNYTYQYSYQD